MPVLLGLGQGIVLTARRTAGAHDCAGVAGAIGRLDGGAARSRLHRWLAGSRPMARWFWGVVLGIGQRSTRGPGRDKFFF